MAGKRGKKKSITIEFKNVNWKPEELHRAIAEATKNKAVKA
jgi:hypothetical protein